MWMDHRALQETQEANATKETPKSRRLMTSGALMLGIDWSLCVVAGLYLMPGDLANAQIAIPFYATAGLAVETFPDSVGLGAILMFPTIVQTVGAILIISGIVNRHRARRLIEVSAGPVVFPQKGHGVGMTIAI